MDEVLTRCPWCGTSPDYVAYHDNVWGVPEYDDKRLFAMLVLEGQQAGLNWITILRKKPHYKQAFFNLDPERLAAIKAERRTRYITDMLNNKNIIRNKLKINAIFQNADAYMALQQQNIVFSEWLWAMVGGAPIVNQWRSMEEVPAQTELSVAMAKQLKKAGFKFIGPTIVYAFMQATGMVNDHLIHCFRHQPLSQ